MNFFKIFFNKFKKKKKNGTNNNINYTEKVSFDSEIKCTVKENERILIETVKKLIDSPSEIMTKLAETGIKTLRIKNAEKKLKLIGLEEGFIPPMKGIPAIKFNTVTNFFAAFSTKTSPLFVFDIKPPEIYTVLFALHKYYAYKSKLPGCDYKSLELLHKSTGKNSAAFVSKMSIKDIIACKQAVARDMEATDFALRISKEFAGARNAMKKLKSDNSAML